MLQTDFPEFDPTIAKEFGEQGFYRTRFYGNTHFSRRSINAIVASIRF
jgi:hypothetical protein